MSHRSARCITGESGAHQSVTGAIYSLCVLAHWLAQRSVYQDVLLAAVGPLVKDMSKTFLTAQILFRIRNPVS